MLFFYIREDRKYTTATWFSPSHGRETRCSVRSFPVRVEDKKQVQYCIRTEDRSHVVCGTILASCAQWTEHLVRVFLLSDLKTKQCMVSAFSLLERRTPGERSTTHSPPAFFFFFLFFPNWRSARAHYFHSLCQDQSTVAQRAEMTVTECSLMSCV